MAVKASSFLLTNMQFLVWTTLFLFGYVSASPAANNYIDRILNTTFQEHLRTLLMDPAALPDFETEFEDNVVVVGKVKGKAEYSDGKFKGLSRMVRRGDCNGPATHHGVKSIHCTLSFAKLKVEYDGQVKYGKMPRVNIEAEAKSKNHTLWIEVIQIPPLQPILKNFTLGSFNVSKIEMEGLSVLNRFLTVLEDGFRREVNTTIYNFVNQRLHNVLGQAVGANPMP